ncbi:RES family NAD+ phosphorylase [Roseateles sp.]|uniref:RES family NAD+ phosphorylase n=1 Tax=Roseateles sp. TaxID=1971397 RepID=UPI003BA9BADC
MNYVCLTCLTDDYLRRNLAHSQNACDFCQDPGPSVLLDEVSKACEGVLANLFFVVHETWPKSRKRWQPKLGFSLTDVVQKLDAVGPQALQALGAATLERWGQRVSKGPYTDENQPWFHIRNDLHAPVSVAWTEMERSLREEARYLNPHAQRVLTSVLGGIHHDRDENGKPVVIEAGPGCEIHRLVRARVFESQEAIAEALSQPAKFLGPPPPGKGKAGRMNAKGQPAFYGATDARVALAEVRPPVGAWVVTAAFEITRRVKLLDLRGLAGLEYAFGKSLFDPATQEAARRQAFLRMLAHRLMLPVLPEFEERDYFITQVIADYLAMHGDEPIDGIVYPSVQAIQEGGPLPQGARPTTGINVALFPRSTRVEGADGGPMFIVDAWDEQEGGRFLMPLLSRLPPAELPVQAPERAATATTPTTGGWNDRPYTLRLDVEGLRAHWIRGVQVHDFTDDLVIMPAEYGGWEPP